MTIMKKFIKINIRTKMATAEWSVGGGLMDTLYNFQENLIPEQISHNPDKFNQPFLGKKMLRFLGLHPLL